MSRYSANLPDGGELAWGYDRPTSSYFIQRYDADEELVFDVSSQYSMRCHPDYPGKTKFSNGELLEIFNDYAKWIHEAHIQALSLDMEF